MHAAALLLLATTSSFVLPPQGSVMRVAHRQRSAPQMNWLKNLVDPEDAMGRNVLADELAGGDGSAPPKHPTHGALGDDDARRCSPPPGDH